MADNFLQSTTKDFCRISSFFHEPQQNAVQVSQIIHTIHCIDKQGWRGIVKCQRYYIVKSTNCQRPGGLSFDLVSTFGPANMIFNGQELDE